MTPALASAPRLIVLCGLPFSGKSTLGRRLADELGLVHLELDQIMASQGVDLSAGAISNAVWITGYREGHRQLDRLLVARRSVVWDAVSFRWSHREKLRRMAKQHGASIHLIWLDIPLADVAQRRAANRLRPVRGDVADADFAMVADGFQPPRAEEAAVRYDPPTNTIANLIERLGVLSP